MTAIAGVCRWDANDHLNRDCGRMLKALAIYGPDEQAVSALGEIAVGRCLSKLLPEDAFDVQPIADHDHLLVADVRLDNRDELIDMLALSREWARQAADSALLFAALERWGDETPSRLIGDYAFAFWDGRRRRLLLARDPFGQRPLHFHRAPHFFAFASMPKGLHALPDVPCAPDLTRLADRVARVRSRGSRSFYAGIDLLEPGHLMVVTREGIQVRRHWRPQQHIVRLRKPEEYAEALREVLDRAVASRLRGVDQVASHLSGGLDSTSVTAAAARLQAERNGRIIAFTAAPRHDYRGPRIPNRFDDESGHAAAVAALYANLEHVILRPDGRGPLDELGANIALYDKPLLSPCNAVWMHGIYAAARARGIRVLLGADLGNATISYNGRQLFAESFLRGRFMQWAREGAALRRQGWGRWRGVLKDTFGNALRRSWQFRVQWAGRTDAGNENLGALAGWGIDRRDPSADRRVVEFCLSVPTEQYLRDGVPSSLLRRAMADRLPALVLNERRKGLQSADWHESVSRARDDILAEFERWSGHEAIAKCLDVATLRAAVQEWPTEGWERPKTVRLYHSRLLRSVAVGHFARHVLAAAR